MEEKTLATLVKIFVVLISASILALVAFGVGVSVGAHFQGTPRISSQVVLPTPGETLPVESTPAPAERIPTPTRMTTVESTPTSTGLSGGNSLDVAFFQEVWDLLQKQFYGDLPEGREITYDAVRGLVSGLGDPYTAFVDPKHAALFNSDIEGHFEGIGARVSLAEGGGVLLDYLFPEQPAEKAGLQVGDVITAVDGQDVTSLNLLEAIGLIRGPRNSKVVLTIQRDNQSPFDVTVVRARIEIPVVATKTLADGKITYIALSEFSSVAPERLAGAVKEALTKNPDGVILDLRGNPGGLLDAAVQIGSYFVPKGNILIERTKDGSERVYKRQGRYLLGDTPLVVLVDGGSASAAEIVAGAIQDAGTGVLIGEKTFGKGSVQLPNTLSDGSQLRVTIAHWFTPQGRGIHGTGLEPDIVVPYTKDDAAAQRDPQLDRAVKYLSNGK